jgi:hypothetical protein
MIEVMKKPLPTRKFGASTLLCYVLRGASSRFHSKAERVLQLLMDSTILGIGHVNFFYMYFNCVFIASLYIFIIT